MAQRIYAIGDIHGHLDKLRTAHTFIEADQHGADDAQIVHVGDLIDRGPDSAGVLEYLSHGAKTGKPWVNLMGNHDLMMSLFLDNPHHRVTGLKPDYSWMHDRIGGRETLASYGVDWQDDLNALHQEAVRAVPAAHRDFLAQLKYQFHWNSVLFVHAGIRPGIALDKQDRQDLIWIRKDFHNDDRDHGALIVHGHTPIDQATHYGNRINIDSGAAWGHDLSAIVIDGDDVFHLTADGRVPIHRENGITAQR